MALLLIGYWRNDAHPEYPDPGDFIDTDWGDDDRDAVGTYLSGGVFLRGCMGLSPCRICGQPNGASEYTDGVLVWPEGLGHYVTDHGVRLPSTIEHYILERVRFLETQVISTSWWAGGAPEPTSIAQVPLAPLHRLAWWGNVQLVQDPNRRFPQLLVTGDTLRLHADGPESRQLVEWYVKLMHETGHAELPWKEPGPGSE